MKAPGIFAAALLAGAPSPAGAQVFQLPEFRWRSKLEESRKAALDEKKPLLVVFR